MGSKKKSRKGQPEPQNGALPTILHDSYKQYKDDTESLVSWLITKAQKTGYDNVLARANSCAGLLEVARHVSTKTRKLPTLISAVARRAIRLRKSVTQSFLGRGKHYSDERHAHFVRVLEEILRMFDPTVTGPETISERTSDAGSWINSFDALVVEDPEDVPETEPVATHAEIARLTATLDDRAENEQDDLSQPFFRLLCLFHDLQQWRSFVVQSWTQYSESKVDLMSAAIVTDQTLKFARDLIADTLDHLPSEFPKKGLSLQKFVLLSLARATHGRLLPPSMELGLPYNVGIAPQAESCFFNVGSLLETFLAVLTPSHAPLYKSRSSGRYDPGANRTKMSAPERYQEDKILLLEVLPDFYLLGLRNHALTIDLDEITVGMVECLRDREISLWHCFAVQLMLDAHHATRHMQMRPFKDLRMTGLRIVRTIDDYYSLSRTHPRPAFWPKEGEDLIKSIRKRITKYIENDTFAKIKSSWMAQMGVSEKQDDHLLFNRNPVLCGIFAFGVNQLMQTVGQGLVSQWFDVQQLAFLLNLARNTPTYGNLTWPDMDLFIQIHGKDHIFMGSLPTDAKGSLTRLEIVSGISSPSRFASNPRRVRAEWYPSDGSRARRLIPTTKTSDLLRKYYYSDAGGPLPRHSIERTELQAYLNELFGRSEPQGARGAKSQRKQAELQLVKTKPEVLLEQKWHNKRSLGFIQLLTLLKRKLIEEEPHFLFNYFEMHKRSMELLRLIRDDQHHKFVQYFTEDYLPDDSMIASLVIYIHHIAQGSAQGAKEMGLTKSGQQVTSRIVLRCAEIMKAYLEKNGATAIKELRTFCNNKTALLPFEGDKKQSKDNGNDDAMEEAELYWIRLGELLDPAQIASLNTGIAMR